MNGMIPLGEAVLCCDRTCDTVWHIRASKTCPRCSFALYVSLGRVLNRPEARHATVPVRGVSDPERRLYAGVGDRRPPVDRPGS